MSGSVAPCSKRRVSFAALVACWLASALAHAQPGNAPEDESEILLQEGERLATRGRYRDAAKSFERALEINGLRGDTYRRLAEMYYRIGEVERAVATLRTAYELEPTKRTLASDLGAVLLEAGHDEEGFARLRFALGDGAEIPVGSSFDRALIALGRHHQRRGDLRAALVATRKLVERGRTSERLIELGRLYTRLSQPQRAIDLFEEVERRAEVSTASRVELAAALATIDCSRAAPLVGALDAEARPVVLLLRGRCALMKGDVAAAFDHARRYLTRASASSALNASDGYGLLGDAHAAAGNLAAARGAYTTALAQGSKARLWSIRLAGLLVREGAPERALAALDKLGESARRQGDEEWWLTRGRAVLALGRRAEIAELSLRLSSLLAAAAEEPQDAELFGGKVVPMSDPRLWALLGELSQALGDQQAAELVLGQALERSEMPRARRAWMASLVAQSAELLAAGEAERAEQVLRKVPTPAPKAATPEATVSVDDALSSAVARNLGLALLARGQAKGAAQAFEVSVTYASRAEALVALLLHGRALAQSGEIDAARARLEQASQMAKGAMRVEVAIERAAVEIATAPEVALQYLTEVKDPEGEADLASRYLTALHQATHAAALARLRAGDATGAFALLDALAAKPGAELALRCNHALAAVAARQRSAASVVKGLGDARCSFGGTMEGLAILSATLDGQIPGNGRRALAQLAAVGRRAPEARALVAAATRVVAITAAEHAYRRANQTAQARRYLQLAAAAGSDIGANELAHNFAVLLLSERLDRPALDKVIAELSRLEGRVPEASVNLGVAYDQADQPQAAVEAWQRARARFAPIVGEWIRAKRAWLEAQ